nr:glutamate receptor ionotropic, kainate 1-like [Onthophagus taurus]
MSRQSPLIYSLLLIAILINITEQKRHLKIGGLFDKNKEETEHAFRLAIDLINAKHTSETIHLQSVVQSVDSRNILAVSSATCSLFGLEIVGLFGPNSSPGGASKHIQALCDNKEMPLIEIHWDPNDGRNNVINLHPHPEIIEDVLIEILQAYEWKKFTIVYDDNESLAKINKLLVYKHNEYSFGLEELDKNEENYRQIMYKIKKQGDTHFVLICSVETLEKFFKQAQQVGLLVENYHYFIYNFDIQTIDMETYQYAGSNITSIRFFDPNSPKVFEFEQELKDYSNYRFPTRKMISFETALLYDAVNLFHQALNDSRSSNKLNPKPLYCDSDYTWEEGSSIINIIKMVTF